ncbi:MAG: FRG domain-containing protein [Candidatus Sulfotelmatobacter sp.]|jgi:hypothetical protein
MFFDERKINNIYDFFRVIESHGRLAKRTPIWFRGSTNRKHSLVPSLGRPPFGLGDETALINAFKQNAIQFVQDRPQSEWEWIFLARHHSVPTRLLDWSESPLIGLYFAINECDVRTKNDSKDGALWLLLPVELNRLASIAPTSRLGLPIFEDNNEDLRNYLPSVMASEHGTHMKPAAGIAIRHSKRMQAQFSVFTVTHRDQTPLESLGDKQHIGRYIIPASAKARIRRQLETLKIDELGVLPELDNVARLARRPYEG